KIPAAYVLEKLGWKNRREGNVGTWIYHPLIVTNYDNASGEEILKFINKMKDDFKSNTSLDLECEINII
ncbi:UDP-N-acetylenolpyruvoylglucosamine reductase, partial [Candidatus Dojkabacteria bacterium]|nr:UDP-N-acetylenolpyruvoylglucosamine reductase [Candidatus Dojkabacteria bacterium]